MRYRDAMIVWLNGTFSVGKTTTAKALVEHEPRLRLFDPEWVGLVSARKWRHEHLHRYEQAKSWLLDQADLVVDVGDQEPGTAAQEIAEYLGQSPGGLPVTSTP